MRMISTFVFGLRIVEIGGLEGWYVRKYNSKIEISK